MTITEMGHTISLLGRYYNRFGINYNKNGMI